MNQIKHAGEILLALVCLVGALAMCLALITRFVAWSVLRRPFNFACILVAVALGSVLCAVGWVVAMAIAAGELVVEMWREAGRV